MFDTFKFKKVMFCPNCGERHKDIQSKEYGCNLNVFNIGDIIQKAHIFEIREEELICSCNSDVPIFIYILIANRKYFGVAFSMTEAEIKLSREYDFNDFGSDVYFNND